MNVPRVLARAVLAALAAVMVTVVPASAGPVVDPNTLQPPPPPGSECQLNGQWIICQTAVAFAPVNEPIFELPCGTVYWTGSDVRSGIRWYNGYDRKLAKRFVTHDVDSTVSLSPTGAGPTATLVAHFNFWTHYAVPGDESSGSGPQHGIDLAISAPGYGMITLIAGLSLPDETHHGRFSFPEEPEVAAELCAALTA